MKNKPVLTIGKKSTDILFFVNENEPVNAIKIYNEFNLNGNGIYLRQLLEKGLIQKEKRGIYKITENGRKLLNLILNMENQYGNI